MANSKNLSIEAALAAALRQHTHTGQHLVVGFSGGIDSTTLLHGIYKAAALAGATLAAVHVHHGLSAQADTWAAHCAEVCQGLHIPLSIEKVDVEKTSADGLEAAARRARQRVFAQTPGDWIVLAHHRNDQAETLLFNLLRGAGLRGAAAMAPVNGRLLRPLLEVSRATIEAYAQDHALRWIEDESNTDTRFSRNHLRHAVLAGLEQRFVGATANLAAAARRFGEAQQLLDQLALLDLAGHAADFPLAVAVLARLDAPRAKNLMRFLLQQRHIGIPSEARLTELTRQLVEAASERHPAAVFGAWRIFRRRGQVMVEAADEPIRTPRAP